MNLSVCLNKPMPELASVLSQRVNMPPKVRDEKKNKETLVSVTFC